MTINKIIKKLPYYAEDVKEGLIKVFYSNSFELPKKLIFGIALTCGYALKNEVLLNYIRDDAKEYLNSTEADACKIAVSNMALTNTYQNFRKFSSDVISPSNLELALINLKEHSINEDDFTIYCLTASILNCCDVCVRLHIEKLKKANLSDSLISEVGKVTSIIKGLDAAFEIEKLRSYDFDVRE